MQTNPRRLTGLDALRGLMLVMMTLTHMPTTLGRSFEQALGHVSSAEGFVLLSGFLAGTVYLRRLRRNGVTAMRTAIQRRARQVYFCHAGLLLLGFTLIAALGFVLEQDAITTLFRFYFSHPVEAIFGGALLLYRPPLFDILPMYALWLLITPALLTFSERRGWGPILAASFALWFLDQHGAGAWLHGQLTTLLGLPVPIDETGAFRQLSWQLLWVAGLWLGARHGDADAPLKRISGRWIPLALAIVAVGFLWRHFPNHMPLPNGIPFDALFDKWQLGPLRLINLAALALVILRFGPALLARLPGMHLLETLGRASLPVFCAHLVLTLLCLALLGGAGGRTVWFESALLLTVIAALYQVAIAHQTLRPPSPDMPPGARPS